MQSPEQTLRGQRTAGGDRLTITVRLDLPPFSKVTVEIRLFGISTVTLEKVQKKGQNIPSSQNSDEEPPFRESATATVLAQIYVTGIISYGHELMRGTGACPSIPHQFVFILAITTAVLWQWAGLCVYRRSCPSLRSNQFHSTQQRAIWGP